MKSVGTYPIIRIILITYSLVMQINSSIHYYGIGKAFCVFCLSQHLIMSLTKSPKESVKVDIPLEYFPSLIQHSHCTDLVISEAGEVFIYKPDFTVIVSSKLKTLLRVDSFFINLIDNN